MLEETLETYGVTDEVVEQVPRRRPRTRGLKRALALERQIEFELANHLNLNEQLAMVINENRESWLVRANKHI